LVRAVVPAAGRRIYRVVNGAIGFLMCVHVRLWT